MHTTQYKFLNPNTLIEDANGLLYKLIVQDGEIRVYEAMNYEKVETIRIDENTVEDVSSQFDLTLGEYVETGRVTRAEPLPPPEPDRIAQLEQENDALTAETVQLRARDAQMQDDMNYIMDSLASLGVE